jgi:hypothetical protein
VPVNPAPRPVQYLREFAVRQLRELNSPLHIPAQSACFKPERVQGMQGSSYIERRSPSSPWCNPTFSWRKD